MPFLKAGPPYSRSCSDNSLRSNHLSMRIQMLRAPREPRLHDDRVACRQRLPSRRSASARALETSSLSAHIGLVSADVGDNFLTSFSHEPLGACRIAEYVGTRRHVLSANKPVAASCGGPHEQRSRRKWGALRDVRYERKCVRTRSRTSSQAVGSVNMRIACPTL